MPTLAGSLLLYLKRLQIWLDLSGLCFLTRTVCSVESVSAVETLGHEVDALCRTAFVRGR